MEKLPASTAEQIHFKHEYFRKLSTKYWFYKIEKCEELYNEESNLELKAEYVIDIYTTYLQLIEIFFINLAAASAPAYAFMPNLFISNSDIRELVSKFSSDNSSDIESYLTHYQKQIIELNCKDNKRTVQDALRLYKSLLLEVARDYMQDYELLNAFKHGFRVEFVSGDGGLSISGGGSTFQRLVSTDAAIHYYSKHKEKSGEYVGKTVVFEHDLGFNAFRIFGKATFICTLFDNLVARERQRANPESHQQYRWCDLASAGGRWKASFQNFRFKSAVGLIEDL